MTARYDLSNTIISNLDDELVEQTKLDKSYGKAGLCANAISDALERSNIRFYGAHIYYFAGEIYKSVDDIKNIIYRVVKHIDDDGKLMARLTIITNICLTGISGHKLNVDANLICFKNCILNIATEETLDFSPEYHVIYQLDYDYSPNNKPVLWLKFLDEVLGDKDSITLLQEFLGLIFVDRKRVKIETMLFLLGSGANGKSVVFDTVGGVLGSKNVCTYEITALTNSADKGKNLMDINGKLLNYCSEVSAKTFSSSSFKSLVSGEPQQARPIYGDPVKIEDIPLMMANANIMPSYKDMSDGVFRRIAILPFNKTIPEHLQDKALSSKMKAEYSAILNWILDGRRNIAKKGFILEQSDATRNMMLEYRRENNTVYQFIEDSYKSSGEKSVFILAKEMYTEYINYCDVSGLEVENVTNFGRTLKLLGFEKVRSSQGITYKVYD